MVLHIIHQAKHLQNVDYLKWKYCKLEWLKTRTVEKSTWYSWDMFWNTLGSLLNIRDEKSSKLRIHIQYTSISHGGKYYFLFGDFLIMYRTHTGNLMNQSKRNWIEKFITLIWHIQGERTSCAGTLGYTGVYS